MTSIKQLQQDYTHIIPIVVKWGEMDAFQHINNVAYIRYLEDARLALFAQLGMLNDLTDSNKGSILANISCDYLAPATYPDTIHIATNIQQTGPKKISLEQVIYSERLDKLAARSSSLVICNVFLIRGTRPIWLKNLKLLWGSNPYWQAL